MKSYKEGGSLVHHKGFKENNKNQKSLIWSQYSSAIIVYSFYTMEFLGLF